MGESLVEAPKVENKMGESFTHIPCLQESVSFGRFEHDSLCWERWSTFPTNKYLEEVEKCSTPGSVAQKKAYFEAHYKRVAARKAELMDQEKKMEDEGMNMEDRSPLGSTCNTIEEEFDVERSSTQNSVDGSEVLSEVDRFSGEMNDKHIDIPGHCSDILVEEDSVEDLTSELSEHIDEMSDGVDVVDEVSDCTVEVNEHIDGLNDDVVVVRQELQPDHIKELNDEELNDDADMVKQNKDMLLPHIKEAGVAEEETDIQSGHIDQLNTGTFMNKENNDLQPQLADATEDSCLKMEIPQLEKPDEPVFVKEDTASVRVWQDKEVLPQEKVEERKIAKKEAKNPVKLVDPMKMKKTPLVKKTIDTTSSKKKPASPIPRSPAASMAKSPIKSTPKSSKAELTKTVKPTTRPTVKKENVHTPVTNKKATRPESKRVLPASVHMSHSLGPANSDPPPHTPMRKSLIMEKMGDKDIVKRAFKAFQNVNHLSPSGLVKPNATNQSAASRVEMKASAPETPQEKKEGISKPGKATSPITGLQGTKKTSQSPGLKKNIGVDQRNDKAVPDSFGSRNGKFATPAFGSRSLNQGRLQREVPKKLVPKTNMQEAGKIHLQSKVKATAADIGKMTRSINSKPKLSSSYNQERGFLRGSVHKVVDAKV